MVRGCAAALTSVHGEKQRARATPAMRGGASMLDKRARARRNQGREQLDDGRTVEANSVGELELDGGGGKKKKGEYGGRLGPL